MGKCRACDRALGIAAVSRTAVRRVAICALAAMPLAGCNSLGDILGAVTGTAAAAGSANPALGIAVGVSTRAVAGWGIRAVAGNWRRNEQDVFAASVGTMEVGEVRPWQVRHDLPIGNRHGEVRVLRAFETPLARCKEALFSVASGDEPDATRRWFLTSACNQAEGWKWAAAEPATERWGSLQ
jgi:predicted small secreted protein